jgi:hypothetical protein
MPSNILFPEILSWNTTPIAPYIKPTIQEGDISTVSDTGIEME